MTHSYVTVYLRSKLTEDGTVPQVFGALVAGLADASGQAPLVGGDHCTYVPFSHGDAGQGRVAHRVASPGAARRQRAVRERRLQSVQQVHHDVDELRRMKAVALDWVTKRVTTFMSRK